MSTRKREEKRPNFPGQTASIHTYRTTALQHCWTKFHMILRHFYTCTHCNHYLLGAISHCHRWNSMISRIRWRPDLNSLLYCNNLLVTIEKPIYITRTHKSPRTWRLAQMHRKCGFPRKDAPMIWPVRTLASSPFLSYSWTTPRLLDHSFQWAHPAGIASSSQRSTLPSGARTNQSLPCMDVALAAWALNGSSSSKTYVLCVRPASRWTVDQVRAVWYLCFLEEPRNCPPPESRNKK